MAHLEDAGAARVDHHAARVVARVRPRFPVCDRAPRLERRHDGGAPGKVEPQGVVQRRVIPAIRGVDGGSAFEQEVDDVLVRLARRKVELRRNGWCVSGSEGRWLSTYY